jgi:maltose alpha-D-glucosyltransferase/alpha-amylase
MRANLGIRRRLAPLVGNDRRALELLHGLLFALPGSPVLYYGDEIGMGDDITLPDRDGVRTPMQWTVERSAGFSDTDPARLYPPVIDDEVYGPAAVNVATQQADPGSLLNWIRNLLTVRRDHPEMGLGSFEILDHGNDAVLAFLRAFEDRTTLVLANVSEAPQAVHLPTLAGRLLGDEAEPGVDRDGFTAEIGPLEFRWLPMAPEA